MAKTVLIIDDDELFLMTMRNVLEDAGYRVLSTADGPQGVQIYMEQKPDLVLLDLGLPSMSGIDVLRQVKNSDARSKVVIVTGYAADESLKEVSRLGAVDFIEKSTDTETLLRKISYAMEQH